MRHVPFLQVVLTDTDLEVIRRIRQRMYPSLGTDTTEMVEFDNPAVGALSRSRRLGLRRRSIRRARPIPPRAASCPRSGNA